CIDHGDLVLVLEADIDPCAVTGWPNAMRQLPDGDGRNFGKIVCAIHLNLVQTAHGDVSEHAICVAHDVDVVGDRTSVECLQQREWRLCLEDLSLANVFQGEPNLKAVRGWGDLGGE